MRAAVEGLFTVAELHGDSEIARGELMRFFAEAAWVPTALLPSQGVQLTGVHNRSANATLTDGPLSSTLLFSFSDEGLITSAHAAARGAVVGKQTVMLPWEDTWSNYERRDGMRVPMAGEATWLRPEGRKTYFHGEVRSLRFTFWPLPALDPESRLPPGPTESAPAQGGSGAQHLTVDCRRFAAPIECPPPLRPTRSARRSLARPTKRQRHPGRRRPGPLATGLDIPRLQGHVLKHAYAR